MTRDFAFIDVLQGTAESNKSLALRHVMKGKNLGKTHPQRRRKRQDDEADPGPAPLSARVQPPKRRQVRPPDKSAGVPPQSDDSSLKSCRAGSGSDSISTLSLCQTQSHPQGSSDGDDGTQRAAWLQHISPVNIGDNLVPLAMPLEMTRQSLRTFDRFFNCSMHSLYPVPLCLALETHKHWWVRLFLADETSFHTAMALMGTLNDFIIGQDPYNPDSTHDTTSPPSLSSASTSTTSRTAANSSNAFATSSAYHLQQAVALVNQRLDHPELALSDSNLVVINTLILQCLVMKKKHEADVHISGLQAMVKMRGGLATVTDEFLAGKICKTELDYALHYGHPTTFHHDQMSRVFTHLENQGFAFPNILGTSSDPQSRTQWAHALTPSLRQILFDTLSIAHLFNSNMGKGEGGWKLTPGLLQDFTVSIGSRLLRFHALGSSYDLLPSSSTPSMTSTRSTATTSSSSSKSNSQSSSSSPFSRPSSSGGSDPAIPSTALPNPERSDNKPMTPLEAAIHIGLTSFLTTLFVQQSGHTKRFLRYDLVARRLREVVDAIVLGRGGNDGGGNRGDDDGDSILVSVIPVATSGEGVGFRVSPVTASAGITQTVAGSAAAAHAVGGDITRLGGAAGGVRGRSVLGVTSGAVGPGRGGSGVLCVIAGGGGGMGGGREVVDGDRAFIGGRGVGFPLGASGVGFPAFLDTLSDAAGDHHGHRHVGGGGVDDGVILWLLLIGSVSVLFEVEHEVWLEERMRLMAQRVGVREWKDVQACVAGRFPWIERMADQLGSERWEKAMRGVVSG